MSRKKPVVKIEKVEINFYQKEDKDNGKTTDNQFKKDVTVALIGVGGGIIGALITSLLK
ncbi:hypothetical protein SAMN02745116_02529 [Pilibacter termitis]|uniref:Uncharacterized protein n=1 Tax=Pilibacter termitis TaxID=263852 RepID=A0A1T4RBR9_9ENTE|nr:hypothetical protein [Pilibacter termitis]SKA13500.1 hypothetical protein SAMN02745116_02529 [Pilibacter termitis]